MTSFCIRVEESIRNHDDDDDGDYNPAFKLKITVKMETFTTC